jgi:hypothetical protein
MSLKGYYSLKVLNLFKSCNSCSFEIHHIDLRSLLSYFKYLMMRRRQSRVRNWRSAEIRVVNLLR